MAAKTWAAASDGNWGVAGNWSPSGIPQAGDTVTFDATSTKNCNVEADTNVIASLTSTAGYTGAVSTTTWQYRIMVNGAVTLAGGTWSSAIIQESASANINSSRKIGRFEMNGSGNTASLVTSAFSCGGMHSMKGVIDYGVDVTSDGPIMADAASAPYPTIYFNTHNVASNGYQGGGLTGWSITVGPSGGGTINMGGSTVTAAYGYYNNGGLTMTSGTLTINGGPYIDLIRLWTPVTPNGGKVVISVSGDIESYSWDIFYDLEITGASVVVTNGDYLPGNWHSTHTFTVKNGAEFRLSNPNTTSGWTQEYAIVIDNGTFKCLSHQPTLAYLNLGNGNSGDFWASSGNTYFTGSAASNYWFFYWGGAFHHNNGVVIFNGGTQKDIYAGGDFYDLTFSGASCSSINNFLIVRNLNINSGNIFVHTNYKTTVGWHVDGAVYINGGQLGAADNQYKNEFGSLQVESGATYYATQGTTYIWGRDPISYYGVRFKAGSTLNANGGTFEFYFAGGVENDFGGQTPYNVYISQGAPEKISTNLTCTNNFAVVNGNCELVGNLTAYGVYIGDGIGAPGTARLIGNTTQISSSYWISVGEDGRFDAPAPPGWFSFKHFNMNPSAIFNHNNGLARWTIEEGNWQGQPATFYDLEISGSGSSRYWMAGGAVEHDINWASGGIYVWFFEPDAPRPDREYVFGTSSRSCHMYGSNPILAMYHNWGTGPAKLRAASSAYPVDVDTSNNAFYISPYYPGCLVTLQDFDFNTYLTMYDGGVETDGHGVLTAVRCKFTGTITIGEWNPTSGNQFWGTDCAFNKDTATCRGIMHIDGWHPTTVTPGLHTVVIGGPFHYAGDMESEYDHDTFYKISGCTITVDAAKTLYLYSCLNNTTPIRIWQQLVDTKIGDVVITWDESDLMTDISMDHITADFTQAEITADIEMAHITFTVEDFE